MKKRVSGKMKEVIPLSKDLSPEIFGDTPESMMYEIILRLPVDVATRCKQLSTQWNSLISNPNFGKSHFEISNTREADPHDNALVVHSFDYEDEGNTSAISIINLNSRSLVPHFEFSYVQSDFSRKPRLFLVGCDAGIICFYSTLAAHESKIYMWNPIIKQYKSIPPFNIPGGADTSLVVLGFGYDPVGNDFKVVRAVPPSFSVEVYSANMNAWQNINSKPSHIDVEPNFESNFDLSVNGFLLTAGTYGMITFDLNKQLFNCIKFPVPQFDPTLDLFNTYENPTRITQFHHSIAVIICERTEFVGKIELWALDDESCFRARAGGIEASWNIMFSFDSTWELQYVHGYFFNTDAFLQLVADVWYLYNPNNHVLDSCDTKNEDARIFANAFYCRQIFQYRKCLCPIV